MDDREQEKKEIETIIQNIEGLNATIEMFLQVLFSVKEWRKTFSNPNDPISEHFSAIERIVVDRINEIVII